MAARPRRLREGAAPQLDGRLEDSFAVEPLRLPPYSGGLSGELPLYATGYIGALSRRYAHFVLRGRGQDQGQRVLAYDIFYSAVVEGQTMYGRDVLLLPERPGAREGVDIVMLTLSNGELAGHLAAGSGRRRASCRGR